MQIFQLFFSQAVWELIVSETNRYAEQSLSEKSTSHQSQWTPTTIPEMMAFVALLMCMGINRRPQYNMYWSKWDILHSAIYPATMSRNRFQAILNFLHLANNEEARKSKDSSPDKLVKVRKFIQMIVPSFLCHYKPGQNLSPDETMIKFKGRLLFKQYMPKKPTKWGIKCFSLNESDTGYTCAWQIYTGSQSQTATTADSERQSEADHPARVPLPGQVVLELLNGLDNRGHCIFADNWYTSPALVNKLTQRGFGFCGTVRYSTQGVSNFANPKKFPMAKGQNPRFYDKSGQLCVTWQDKKRVTLLSNYGDCSVTSKQIRCKKSPTGYRDISKPNGVIEYNKHMGGTDLAGQQCVYYAHAHRSVKWWKRVFLAILDICVLNARILYNSIHTNRTLSNVDFRMYLIQGLLLTWKNGPVTHVQMSNPCVSEGAQHFPGKNVTGKKRDCIVCSTKAQRRQTRTICKQCDKPMCVIGCFEKFHSP